MAQRIPARYRRFDAWHGYKIPGTAIAGASVYDEHSEVNVALEIRQLRRDVLIPNGIKSRGVWGESSNVFCAKRWICVAAEDFARAKALVEAWLEQHRFDTQYIHNAV
jgi:hypothetical protein